MDNEKEKKDEKTNIEDTQSESVELTNDEEMNNDKETEEATVKNTMSDKTRYTIVGVVSIILLGLIILLIVFGSNDNKVNNEKVENSNVNEVTERNTSTDALKEFYEEFDSKELNVIFFASSTCGYCSLEKPIIEQISKDYNMDYYSIDASTLDETEANEMIKALGISGATPTTAIVKEGKVVATNEGYLDGKPYVEFFVKNGVLEKNATYKKEDKLVIIDYKEFKELVKKDETSLVFLDTSACSDCITARSILNNLADKNKFDIKYLSAANLDQEDVNNLVKNDLKELKYNDKTYKDEGQIKIPLLLVIKDNEIKDYVLESTDEADYTKVLKKYEFIK